MDNKNVLIMIILAIILVCVILFSINKLNNTFTEIRENNSSNFITNIVSHEENTSNYTINTQNIENNYLDSNTNIDSNNILNSLEDLM